MNNRRESEPSRGEMVFLRKGEKVFMAFRRFDPVTGRTFIHSDAGLDPRINDGNTLSKDPYLEGLISRLSE